MIIKTFITTVFLVMSVALIYGQEYNKIDSLGNRQGEWREYYWLSGNVKAIKWFKDNNLDGEYKIFNRRGQLKRVHFYDDGRYLMYKTYYRRGKKAGLVRDKNGVKIDRSESTYLYENDSTNVNDVNINQRNKFNQKHGLWYESYIGSIYQYDLEHYYAVGVYENGSRVGQWRFYMFDGRQLRYISNYSKDKLDGKFLIFDNHGHNTVVYHFRRGIKFGEYVAYFCNGQIRYKGKFKNDQLVDEYWEYNRKGRLEKYIQDASKVNPYE